jgi:predicted 3-demethylubiquinone-9 3-methyltransferase (glyoxalase superfamily)
MNKISPCLWFDKQAEEAAKFYVATFKDSKMGAIMRYDDASAKASGLPAGTVLTVSFQLFGQDFTALNGGPQFKFSEAVSFMVECEDQAEIDYYWDALTADGGEESMCGWLKDKFGLSWQIIPKGMDSLVSNPKAMAAMLQMKKIDIEVLEQTSKS